MTTPSAMFSGQHPQIWNSARHLDTLPLIDSEDLVPAGARAVIVAPHPGDEVGIAGGLLQQLCALGHPLQLLSITDGSSSHPGSHQWSQERLSVFRPQESVEALRRLGLPMHSLKWVRAGFADNSLSEREHHLVHFIARYLKAGDVLFSTWREDGNADHDAAGRASAKAALMVGARFIEVPIWAWHWPVREQDRIPWHRAHKLRLDTWTTARKRHAMHSYASQLNGEPEIGIAPLLPRVILDRMGQPFEVVFL